MKLLHIADLHIGKVVNGFPMIDDQRHALEQVLRIADERRIDALLIAGDVYDKTAPSAEAVSLVDWLLTAVGKRGIACFVIPGNHDSAERIAYGGGLMEDRGVHMAPLYDGTVRKVTLEDGHGPVDFWLLPFLKPALVRPFFPDEDIGSDYGSALRAALGACGIDPARRNVLVAHQFVTAGGDEPARSDSEVVVGGLENVDASLFDGFDYVALGHIHRPQRIGRDEVRYAGSLLKYSASEVDHPKSAALVELGGKDGPDGCEVRIELEPIGPLHDMRRIKGRLSQLTDPDVVSQADPDDYFHVTLTDGKPIIDALAKLRAVYPNVMSLAYESAGGSIEAGPVEGGRIEDLDPLDLFEHFYEERNDEKLDDASRRIVEEALREQMADPDDAGSEDGEELL